MKIIGIVLVVCACAGTGIHSALRLRNDERLWMAWETLLRRLYEKLRYTAQPIQDVMATIETKDLQVLSWLTEAQTEGALPLVPSSLCDEENVFVHSFFDLLGKTDLQGQLHHIERHAEEALLRAQQARDRYRHRAKSYVTTGICAGLCLGLLLL